MRRKTLLLAGGSADPCLSLVGDRARRMGIEVIDLLHDGNAEPSVKWDLENGLQISGVKIEPDAAFIRMDVFGSSALETAETLPRAPGWFSFAMGILARDNHIKLFNRSMNVFAGVKLSDLQLANSCGLAIPKTIVSNDLKAISDFSAAVGDSGCVAKPVNGGGYCKSLDEAIDLAAERDGVLPLPAFVQEKLSYPEFRVYKIGGEWLLFRLDSGELDYRIDPSARIDMFPLKGSVIEPHLDALSEMTKRLGIDFCAFDLKTRNEDGTVCFLEVNTGPMFAIHDHASGGLLSKLLVEQLLN